MHRITASHRFTAPATVLPRAVMPSAAEEMNHRVANQLQLLAALVTMEARGVFDPESRTVLERIQQRIAALGSVHRHLYQSDHGEVDLGDYLEELGTQLSHSLGPDRHIDVDAETVAADGSIASLIGILATELVTNACKHAYRAGEPGNVAIHLRRLPTGAYRFTVADHGAGLRPDAPGEGLGTRLIQAIVARLGAIATWEDARPGSRFCMEVRF